MFCTNCGTQMPEDQKFCTNCGAALQPNKQAVQPYQTTSSNLNKKTPETTQVAANPIQKTSASQQPIAETQNSPTQIPHKQSKQKTVVFVIIIIVVLILSGIGAAAYFTHGFGLLKKQENSEQTADNSSKSDSDNSSKSSTQKTETKKDTEEKSTVKVSNISFETTQAAKPTGMFSYEIGDVYCIKGTIENTTDKYVEASPSFIFKVSYKDKYGDEQNGDATLQSPIETSDGFGKSKIFLVPHEKKEFIYYVNQNSSTLKADAIFNIGTTQQSNSTPDNLSLLKGDVTVNSVELKKCPFTPITNLKTLTPDEAKVDLSYTSDGQFGSYVTGTVTNTTKDKWASATVYCYAEMDGYFVLGSLYHSENISSIKPDANIDFKLRASTVSDKGGHTYEAKLIAVTYQVDKN